MSNVMLSWGASSHTGRRRAANEDSYLADAPVFLVADGMGGHEAGAEASERAIEGFRSLVGRPSVTVEQMQEAFDAAVSSVESIATRSFAAGTTLSGVAVCEQVGEPYWLVLNIGDSRTYRLCAGRLEQISIDHSAVQGLLDAGEIDESEAERHPQRNVVTRAVGAGSSGLPDYWLLPMERGERLMICSDGLTKELSTEDIRRSLDDEPDAGAAARRLVDEAVESGGKDNVTVIVVDAVGLGDLDIDEDTLPRPDLDENTVPRPRAEEGDDRGGL